MKTLNLLGDIIDETVHDPALAANERKSLYIQECLILIEKMIGRPLTKREGEFEAKGIWNLERDATCPDESPLQMLHRMSSTGSRHCITFPPPILTDAERAAVAPLPVLNPVIASTIAEAVAVPDSPSAAACAAAYLATWWRMLNPDFRRYLRSFGFRVTWNWRALGWSIDFQP